MDDEDLQRAAAGAALMRIAPLVAIAGIVGAAYGAGAPRQADVVTQDGACSMRNSVLTGEALVRLNDILSDTARYFVTLRSLGGLDATKPADVAVATDTVVCRRAIRAIHAYYDTTSDSAMFRSINSGLLVRAGRNRYISVLALFNPWSGSTWTVLDSSFRVVRRNM